MRVDSIDWLVDTLEKNMPKQFSCGFTYCHRHRPPCGRAHVCIQLLRVIYICTWLSYFLVCVDRTRFCFFVALCSLPSLATPLSAGESTQLITYQVYTYYFPCSIFNLSRFTFFFITILDFLTPRTCFMYIGLVSWVACRVPRDPFQLRVMKRMYQYGSVTYARWLPIPLLRYRLWFVLDFP